MDTYSDEDMPEEEIFEEKLPIMPDLSQYQGQGKPGWKTPMPYALIGGPWDGLEAVRHFLGITINNNLITHSVMGRPFFGNMEMPEILRLKGKSRLVDYYLCLDDKRYYYQGLI